MTKSNHDYIEEINILLELIKTISITGLSQTKIKRLLKEYTHSEIRSWKYVMWKFIVNDEIYHD